MHRKYGRAPGMGALLAFNFPGLMAIFLTAPTLGAAPSDSRALLSDPKIQEIIASLIDHPKTAAELHKATRLHIVLIYRRMNSLSDAGFIKVHGLCRNNSQKPAVIYISLLKTLSIEVTRGRVTYVVKYVDGRTEEIRDAGPLEGV